MAILLALDESSSWMAALCSDSEHDGTAQERAYVAALKASGEFGDLPRAADGVDDGLDLGAVLDTVAGPALAGDLVLLADQRRMD